MSEEQLYIVEYRIKGKKIRRFSIGERRKNARVNARVNALRIFGIMPRFCDIKVIDYFEKTHEIKWSSYQNNSL